MLLESRFHGGFQLLDPANHRFDLGASGDVEQGDARPGTGGVPSTGDPGRSAVGNQAEHHGMHGIDVGTECAGQSDAIDRFDAVGVHQEPAPRVQGAFRELDLADVVLRQDQARCAGCLVQHVAVRPAVGDHTIGAAGHRAVDDAVRCEHARQEQLGHQLDDAAAAHARHLGRAEPLFVRPRVLPDHAEARLQRVAIDANPLHSPGCGSLATRDLGAFERGARRARCCQQTITVPEHDLGVRADVDQQVHGLLIVGRLGQDHPCGIGPDVPCDAGQHVDARSRVGRGQVQRGGPAVHRLVGRQRERRTP